MYAQQTDSFFFLRKPGSEGTGAFTPGIAPSLASAGGGTAGGSADCNSGAFPLLLLPFVDGCLARRELLRPSADPAGEAALDPGVPAVLEALLWLPWAFPGSV